MNEKGKLELGLLICIVLIAISVTFALTSCNVTRTVTTTAQHYQRGDTTVTIMTKTTESYDGSVKPQNMFNK